MTHARASHFWRASEPAILVRPGGSIVEANPAMTAWLGVPGDSLADRAVSDFPALPPIPEGASGGRTDGGGFRWFPPPDGGVHDLWLGVGPVERRPATDVSAPDPVADAARHLLVEQSLVGVYVLENGFFSYVNPAWCAIFGYTPDEVRGKLTPFDMTIPEQWPLVRARIEARMAGRDDLGPYAVTCISRDGRKLDCEVEARAVVQGGRHLVVGVATDVTARNHASRRQDRSALQDPLTGVPNRALFFDRIQQALAFSRRSHQTLAVLSVDIDGFRRVNETLGHDVGDRVLQCVAARLGAAVRDADTVARLGGDDFAVLLGSVSDEISTRQVADKLVATVAEPIDELGASLPITVSVGFACFPHGGLDPRSLVRNAESARYRAHIAGGNRALAFRTF